MGFLLNGNRPQYFPGNVIVGTNQGNNAKLVTSNLESEFNAAINNVGPTGPVRVAPYTTPITSTSFVKIQDRLVKKATSGSGLDVTRNAPLFNDPRYTSSTLAIPTDDRTLHGLYRFFKDTDPIVGAAIRIHTELPLANFKLGECEDAGVQAHFEEMADRINLIRILTDGVSEYWTIGNVFFFGAWNEKDYMFDQFTILNPDYVKVESTWINQKPLIKLLPDESLKKIVQTRSPEYLYKQLAPEIIKYVLFNNEIPLHPNNTFVLSHDKAPYETKGRSIIKRILKTLMYEDRMQQAQFAIATRHVVPLTVVKVGDPNTGWIPETTELEALRDMFSAWELDPSFTIFYHYGINVEFYGSSGRILPLGPEFERVYKLKFIGLGVHEQLMTGGGGSYAQAYANLEIQRQRYLNLQLKLEQLVHIGWFKTVAEMCGFYRMANPVVGSYYRGKKYGSASDAGKELAKAYAGLRDYKDNEEFREFFKRKAVEMKQVEMTQRREYVYPKLDWGAMSATNDENYKNYIKWLRKEVPYLVDEATLARIGRLDINAQEKAYFRDLQRTKKRQEEILKAGLTQYVAPAGKGGAGAGGIGGDVSGPASLDIGPLTPGGPDLSNAPAGGGLGEPEKGPVGGAGTAPPTAAGGPPAGTPAKASQVEVFTKLASEVTIDAKRESSQYARENEDLQHELEHAEILKEVGA